VELQLPLRTASARAPDSLHDRHRYGRAVGADEVLAVACRYARGYAGIVSFRDRAGAPIGGFDAQIAAICRAHRATLATRNVHDFRDTGLDVTDPWQASA